MGKSYGEPFYLPYKFWVLDKFEFKVNLRHAVKSFGKPVCLPLKFWVPDKFVFMVCYFGLGSKQTANFAFGYTFVGTHFSVGGTQS